MRRQTTPVRKVMRGVEGWVVVGWGGATKTSARQGQDFWKVQSGMLAPCLAAPCLRQSNTPSHVVCCHGSRDPSHSVCKNIKLVSKPPHPQPNPSLPFQKHIVHLPLQKSKVWKLFIYFFLYKSNVFLWWSASAEWWLRAQWHFLGQCLARNLTFFFSWKTLFQAWYFKLLWL